MESTRGNFGVWLTEGAGLGYQYRDALVYVGVGDQLSAEAAAHLGLVVGRLTDRQIAFLLLLILEHNGELDSKIIAGKERAQRLRFGDYLGMTELAFRKWIERTLAKRPGQIVRWSRAYPGSEGSRTGGPWWLGVSLPLINPDTRHALDFIEGQRRKSANRRKDPSELLVLAVREQAAGQWIDAMTLLEEAKQMFGRRRWSRKSPLWFEILLTRAATEMQLGNQGLQPKAATNIARSVSQQALGYARADLIRAQAHHIAALILNQNDDPEIVSRATAYLKQGRELLIGRTDHAAVREYWKICSYLEITSSRRNATVRPKHASDILQAAQVIDEDFDEKQMRYGEALLNANRPAEAVEYIRPALESGRLSKPAWIIAERFDAMAKWQLGNKAGPTLDELDRLEREASDLGFAHQVRSIRAAKKRVRQETRRKGKA